MAGDRVEQTPPHLLLLLLLLLLHRIMQIVCGEKLS